MRDNKDLISLNTPSDKLEELLLQENDIDQVKNILNIFNLNIKKKDIVRSSKLSELQDDITLEIGKRVTKKPGEFSNKDLLDYFKVIQETLSKSDNSLEDLDVPSIQINQNQLNINMDKDTLSKESRLKVLDAVQSILGKYDIPNQEEIVIENVEEEEIEQS